MLKQIKSSIKYLPRALRLPFLSASALPFIFGSLIARDDFNLPAFIFGLLAALSTHLSSNLINDYADSKTKADEQDTRFFGFFGGSKLIQEHILSQNFYLSLSIFFAGLSGISVIILCVILRNPNIAVYFLAILILAWQYSAGPLRLSYRLLGEPVIFLLFGPALVMGGYFLQTGIFPDIKSFMLSLPSGFFVTSILFANEIPDFADDMKVKKFTLVNFLGPKNSYILYYVLMFLGFASIFIDVILGYLNPLSLASFLFILPTIKAGSILKAHYGDKFKLLNSSKLTILVQNLAGIALIIGILL